MLLRLCIVFAAALDSFGADDCLSSRKAVFIVESCPSGARGTAFLVKINGQIRFLTAHHTVLRCTPTDRIVLRTSSGEAGSFRLWFAHLAAADLKRDLALLEPEGVPPITPLQLLEAGAESSIPAFGNMIFGYSLGTATVHDKQVGVQNGGKPVTLKEHFQGIGMPVDSIPLPTTPVLALTAPIQPGDSGAPLLDKDCRVRGVVSGGWMTHDAVKQARRGSIGEGFAIPVKQGDPFQTVLANNSRLVEMRTFQLYEWLASAESVAAIPLPGQSTAARRTMMMQSEMSHSEFHRLCGEDPECGRPIPPSRQRLLQPVTGLSRAAAAKVCGRVGREGRLPTLAEWKLAANEQVGKPACSFNLNGGPCASQNRPLNRIRSLIPIKTDDYGYADLFGNVFEMVYVDLINKDIVYVGGSYGTKPSFLWEKDKSPELIGTLKRGFLREGELTPAEIGFRCVYYEDQ